MKSNLYLLVSAFLFISCNNTDKTVPVKNKVEAQKVPAPKTADESQTIFNFYKEYFAESNSKDGQRILAEYTTKQFYDVIDLYTSDSENVVLDYEPFLYAQDYDYPTLMKTLKVKRIGENIYRADFQLFLDNAAADNHRSITYKTVSEDGKMKIAEIPSDTVLKDLKYINNEKNRKSSSEAKAVAVNFMNWYQKNSGNFFETVKGGAMQGGDAPQNYYIDFAEVDKEMAFLRKTNFFTEDFLKTYHENYKSGEENFKKNPMNDGPPEGFTADYFFRTNDDFEADLKNIDKVEFEAIPLNPKKVYLRFYLPTGGMHYIWTMKGENGWKIDALGIR